MEKSNESSLPLMVKEAKYVPYQDFIDEITQGELFSTEENDSITSDTSVMDKDSITKSTITGKLQNQLDRLFLSGNKETKIIEEDVLVESPQVFSVKSSQQASPNQFEELLATLKHSIFTEPMLWNPNYVVVPSSYTSTTTTPLRPVNGSQASKRKVNVPKRIFSSVTIKNHYQLHNSKHSKTSENNSNNERITRNTGITSSTTYC